MSTKDEIMRMLNLTPAEFEAGAREHQAQLAGRVGSGAASAEEQCVRRLFGLTPAEFGTGGRALQAELSARAGSTGTHYAACGGRFSSEQIKHALGLA